MTQHKQQLRDYFNGAGFQRWSAIYGEADVSRVRRTIRVGHTRMLADAEARINSWMAATDREPRTIEALDAGCGTGVFSALLARHGMRITAVDIAPQMLAAAAQLAGQQGFAHQMRFINGDIEDVSGRFDLVACFDVLIHYPQPAFDQMLERLARRCNGLLLFTYAPYETLLAAMHWIGGFFPHANRRTEIQLIRESDVRRTLERNQMRLREIMPIRSGFYHVNLVEAWRTGA